MRGEPAQVLFQDFAQLARPARLRPILQARRPLAMVANDRIAKRQLTMRRTIVRHWRESGIEGGETPFRAAWIGAIVDRLEVEQDIVRVFGRKDALEQAVASSRQITPGVRTCVPMWRCIRESNPRCPHERRGA